MLCFKLIISFPSSFCHHLLPFFFFPPPPPWLGHTILAGMNEVAAASNLASPYPSFFFPYSFHSPLFFFVELLCTCLCVRPMQISGTPQNTVHCLIASSTFFCTLILFYLFSHQVRDLFCSHECCHSLQSRISSPSSLEFDPFPNACYLGSDLSSLAWNLQIYHHHLIGQTTLSCD
jgi:hypothetical protein